MIVSASPGQSMKKSSLQPLITWRADNSRMMDVVMNAESEAQINSLNEDNETSLLKWMKRCNTNLVQANGQRKYGGPPAD